MCLFWRPCNSWKWYSIIISLLVSSLFQLKKNMNNSYNCCGLVLWLSLSLLTSSSTCRGAGRSPSAHLQLVLPKSAPARALPSLSGAGWLLLLQCLAPAPRDRQPFASLILSIFFSASSLFQRFFHPTFWWFFIRFSVATEFVTWFDHFDFCQEPFVLHSAAGSWPP